MDFFSNKWKIVISFNLQSAYLEWVKYWHGYGLAVNKLIMMEVANKNIIKIFLVDDDVFCLNLYKQGIKNLGYLDITIFEDGQSCIDNLSQKPDVIFLDQNMDGLNGFEVLKRIKSFDPNIYIIMVSAQEDIKTALSSFKYRVFDYIVKGDDEINKMKNVLIRINEIKTILKKRS